MRTINLNQSTHNFEKQNLITISGTKPHDILKCKCGVYGKSYRLGQITVANKFQKRLFKCPLNKKVLEKIKIKKCTAFGDHFANITPGSIHQVIPAPPPNKDDGLGVWVNGVGAPVKVMNEEFTAT